MEFTTNLSKDEVVAAVALYLEKKGYNLLQDRFNTTASYRRVLFDSKLESWFNDLTVVVEPLNKK